MLSSCVALFLERFDCVGRLEDWPGRFSTHSGIRLCGILRSVLSVVGFWLSGLLGLFEFTLLEMM